MAFIDRNGNTGNAGYVLPMGWRYEGGDLGTITTVTTLTQVSTHKIRGFYMYFQHEILGGSTQAMGIRLYSTYSGGTQITSYGNAKRSDGTTVSSKATDHIQAGSNTTSFSGYKTIGCIVKVICPLKSGSSDFGSHAMAEVTNLDPEHNGIDKWYYTFDLSLGQGTDEYFDYNIYWNWIGGSTSTMSMQVEDVWYTAIENDTPSIW